MTPRTTNSLFKQQNIPSCSQPASHLSIMPLTKHRPTPSFYTLSGRCSCVSETSICALSNLRCSRIVVVNIGRCLCPQRLVSLLRSSQKVPGRPCLQSVVAVDFVLPTTLCLNLLSDSLSPTRTRRESLSLLLSLVWRASTSPINYLWRQAGSPSLCSQTLCMGRFRPIRR